MLKLKFFSTDLYISAFPEIYNLLPENGGEKPFGTTLNLPVFALRSHCDFSIILQSMSRLFQTILHSQQCFWIRP